jgi:hypothetical protein
MPLFMSAQEEDTKPKYGMVQDVYIKAKQGMNDEFEAAVKAHNEAFHKEGPHSARLYSVATGRDVGWYIWEMGPCTYTDLDNRPAKGAHDEDWDNNVGQHVHKVGRVEYWKYNNKLSYAKEGEEGSKWIIWYFDVKRGEWYRFQDFMTKIKNINEKMGESIGVWTNEYAQNDGREVSLSFPFSKWADLDEDDWNMKDEYEKEYGAGTWTNALKEWRAVTTESVREVWVAVD